MLFSTIIISSVLATLTTASPVFTESSVESHLEARTALITTTTSNEFIDNDGCEDVMLIFARGTEQPGNIVGSSPFTLASTDK
jgi:hypothetical protein